MGFQVHLLGGEDYKKLTKVVQYLCSACDLTLTIESDNHPSWWVNSSYAVHPDNISIFMTIGQGSMYTASSKQKLNTNNSMETVLMAIDGYMAQVLWTRHLLVAQEIYVPTSTIYQDRKVQSYWLRMLKFQAEENTTNSIFFFTDNIKKGEVKVPFRPTHARKKS